MNLRYSKINTMKQLFILIATLASLSASGQNTNPTQRILIGFNFSPDYCYRTLKNTDGSNSGDLIIKTRNGIEIAKFGYTTGLNVGYNFSPLVGFETGIQFSNKGYKTINQDLFFFPPNPDLPTKLEITYAYQYIGIPIKAKLFLGKSKFRFLSSVGVMTNFLLNVKQTFNAEYADGRKEKSQYSKSGYNEVDLSPMISVGIDYKLNHKIHLVAEPTFRYGAVETKDTPVTEHLWNAGLNVGFYYALK